MKKQQSGFTLVEIAIVMVIIGLLLGGVLKGQEVITNAKIKNINNDVSGISAAIYSYQDRYSALPGDDAAADAHVNGGVPSDNTAGGTAGDGIIDGNYNDNGTLAGAVPTDSESALAWQHLRAAGLMTGDALSDMSPTHAFGGTTGIQTGVNDQGTNASGIAGLFIAFSTVNGDMAAILDSQNDDNNPDAGSIRAAGLNAPVGGNYVIDGTTNYDVAFEM
ncbi:MAG: prepilin-type N-terminal cleavage/methylation domain-containing protein [Gammaproteobacteria bacterium]|nr:prepilin-type N-terminal cleavage/methylation domain-containing protein [Gammaproteobacteria bacterium]